METVSVSTSKSLSVCNIYIHEQSFRQKKINIQGLNRKRTFIYL